MSLTQRARFLATGISAFVLPSFLARPVLNVLGHQVSKGVRIGFSVLLVERITLAAGATIGHGNLMRCRRLVMRRGAWIGRSNLVMGPCSIQMGHKAELGNRNRIQRGPAPSVTHGPARLVIGSASKVTSDHRIDCTTSVRIGERSILAGAGSQLWTHGYVHDGSTHQRYRIDGSIQIDDDCYIGSGCILVGPIHIHSNIIVGAGATVAKSLKQEGLYASAPLRHLPRPMAPESRDDLLRVDSTALCETVYIKRRVPE